MKDLTSSNIIFAQCLIGLTLLILHSPVTAGNEIFSNISVSADNDEINQCVMEINQAADDGLDTSSRLYQTGICYFCIDCDFEVDNGQLFLVQDAESPFIDQSSVKNFKTAHKLMMQSAGLGNVQAYYGLAVLLYLSELSEIKQAEEELTRSNVTLASNVDKTLAKDEQESSNHVLSQIIEKTVKSKFSQQLEQYLQVSAKKGYQPAQFALSEVYSKGIGVEKDFVQAYAWAATAVAQNPPFGSVRRDEKAAILDTVKLNQAEAIAEEYMKKYTNIFDRASVTVMR